ncbi:dTDP-4-dehydrorhamnose 3,5-epimerase family protein [Rhodoferax sp. BLA1]|uniref:dTDP-4-dehydrorhamnose 3,5-epimerase family protein n=1 Tax=Rhodoferax sp. BLA1 TaxID=2576062 RepID=UPI0015D2C0DF|nr:dTDP-4-dehydrorhamnose 3,5-epimerase family protein [Rhodoferax sp. BLA1]
MTRFAVRASSLDGLKCIERQRLGDARGFLSRLFCSQELAAAGWTMPVAQINHTYTARCGTVRGLHFQHSPAADAKLVSCLRGVVWDVAVDLRAGSATFLQWHAQELSPENGLAMLIPAGFAHGFQTLSDHAELIYCHSTPHTPELEGGVDALDPRLGIAWPMAIVERSARDTAHAPLTDVFEGICL